MNVIQISAQKHIFKSELNVPWSHRPKNTSIYLFDIEFFQMCTVLRTSMTWGELGRLPSVNEFSMWDDVIFLNPCCRFFFRLLIHESELSSQPHPIISAFFFYIKRIFFRFLQLINSWHDGCFFKWKWITLFRFYSLNAKEFSIFILLSCS